MKLFLTACAEAPDGTFKNLSITEQTLWDFREQLLQRLNSVLHSERVLNPQIWALGLALCMYNLAFKHPQEEDCLSAYLKRFYDVGLLQGCTI